MEKAITPTPIDSQRLANVLEDIGDFVAEALERIDGIHAVIDLAADAEEDVPAYRIVQVLRPHVAPLESCITGISNFRREGEILLGLHAEAPADIPPPPPGFMEIGGNDVVVSVCVDESEPDYKELLHWLIEQGAAVDRTSAGCWEVFDCQRTLGSSAVSPYDAIMNAMGKQSADAEASVA